MSLFGRMVMGDAPEVDAALGLLSDKNLQKQWHSCFLLLTLHRRLAS